MQVAEVIEKKSELEEAENDNQLCAKVSTADWREHGFGVQSSQSHATWSLQSGRRRAYRMLIFHTATAEHGGIYSGIWQHLD